MLKTLQGKWKLHQLIGDWKRYREITAAALGGRPLSPGAESEFLKLKARIASRIEAIQVFCGERLDAEARSDLEEIEQQLARHSNATSFQGEETWTLEKFESKWNAQFVALNRLRGLPLFSPPAKSKRAAPIDPAPLPKPHKPMHAPTGYKKPRLRRHVPVNRMAGTLFGLAVLGFVLWLFGIAMGVHREEGRFEVSSPRNVKAALGNVTEELHLPWQPSPDVPEVSRAQQQVVVVPPDPELGAILLNPGQPAAKIRVGTRSSRWLEPGQDFEGWTVARIDRDSVIVTQDDRYLVLRTP